jgi:CRP/FNR family transcriptional regulator, cyclic AMP receptor protein
MEWALLRDLDADERRAVLQTGVRRKLRKGAFVFHEGDLGDTLHLLATGRVAVRVSTPTGAIATLTVLSPGDCFGEQALLSPDERRTATIVALEAVETISISRGDFQSLRERRPGVERLLVEALAAQVRRLSRLVVDAMYVPAERRVVRRLLDLAAIYGQEGLPPVVIPITQEDLATMAGTTRPTANQVLQELARGGALTLDRGRTTIRDLAVLERAAR